MFIFHAFRLSRGKALTWAIVWFSAGCLPPIFINPSAIGMSLVFWVIALFYGSIWFYKRQRDQRMITRARLQIQSDAKQPTPRCNPDSYRLFVPAPHTNVDV